VVLASTNTPTLLTQGGHHQQDKPQGISTWVFTETRIPTIALQALLIPSNPSRHGEKATLNRESPGTSKAQAQAYLRTEAHTSKHSKAWLADSPTTPSVAVLPRRYCFF
jgi:hypothetical protein